MYSKDIPTSHPCGEQAFTEKQTQVQDQLGTLFYSVEMLREIHQDLIAKLKPVTRGAVNAVSDNGKAPQDPLVPLAQSLNQLNGIVQEMYDDLSQQLRLLEL